MCYQGDGEKGVSGNELICLGIGISNILNLKRKSVKNIEQLANFCIFLWFKKIIAPKECTIEIEKIENRPRACAVFSE